MTQWRVLCPHNHLLKTTTTTGDIRELSSYQQVQVKLCHPCLSALWVSERCNPWPHVANRHKAAIVKLLLACYLFTVPNSRLLSTQRPRPASHAHGYRQPCEISSTIDACVLKGAILILSSFPSFSLSPFIHGRSGVTVLCDISVVGQHSVV